MAWDRYLEFIVNLAGRGTSTVLASLSGASTLKAVDVIQNDAFPVRLRFALPTGNAAQPNQVVQVEAGAIIVLSCKQASALSSETLLYFCAEFTEGQDDVGYFYTGILNTNTEEAAAAFSGLSASKATLAVVNEIEIQNPGNTQRTSYQFNGIFRRQVYNGESAPLSGTPSFPPPSQIFLPGRDTFTGSPAVGADYVDFVIPSTCTTLGTLGILRPTAEAQILGLLDLVRVDATTLRVTLSGDVAEEGYQVTIFAFSATPYAP